MIYIPPIDPRVARTQVTQKDPDQDKKKKRDDKDETEEESNAAPIQDEIILSTDQPKQASKPTPLNPLIGHINIKT